MRSGPGAFFEQCLGSDVDMNAAFYEKDRSAAQWGWHIAYENVAFVKAVFSDNLLVLTANPDKLVTSC